MAMFNSYVKLPWLPAAADPVVVKHPVMFFVSWARREDRARSVGFCEGS